jgi:hypothetical protein
MKGGPRPSLAEFLRAHASDPAGLTINEVAKAVLGTSSPSLGVRTKLGAAMHRLGWESSERPRVNGKDRPRVYKPLRVPAPPSEIA